MKIHHLEETTLQDYPGKIACAVFLQGCNFRCSFCHNPKAIDDTDEFMSLAGFFEFLASRKGKLDGVVVSGGEPTIHKELVSFLKNIKRLGFAVKLDTNGSNPKMLKSLFKENLIDYVAMDVKAPFDRYNEVIGKTGMATKIRASIKLVKESGIKHEFRTTVFPGLLQEDIAIIRSTVNGSPLFLQKYRDDVTLNGQKHLAGFSKDSLQKMADELGAEVR